MPFSKYEIEGHWNLRAFDIRHVGQIAIKGAAGCSSHTHRITKGYNPRTTLLRLSVTASVPGELSRLG